MVRAGVEQREMSETARLGIQPGGGVKGKVEIGLRGQLKAWFRKWAFFQIRACGFVSGFRVLCLRICRTRLHDTL